MSEADRLAFVQTSVGNVAGFFSFCFSYREQRPALIGRLYDALLVQKGMVAASAEAFRARVRASGDPAIDNLFTAWTDKKRLVFQRASLVSDGEPEARTDLTRLEREANELERELVKRSSGFNASYDCFQTDVAGGPGQSRRPERQPSNSRDSPLSKARRDKRLRSGTSP